MLIRFSRFLDTVSNFLAPRKGLLPLLGILLIIINGIFQFIPVLPDWLVKTNLLLHFGLVISIIGIMLAWAL